MAHRLRLLEIKEGPNDYKPHENRVMPSAKAQVIVEGVTQMVLASSAQTILLSYRSVLF